MQGFFLALSLIVIFFAVLIRRTHPVGNDVRHGFTVAMFVAIFVLVMCILAFLPGFGEG